MLSSDGIMGPCVPTPDAAEIKPYTFRYSALPHEGDWKHAASYRHGMGDQHASNIITVS